jgi:hypothetical protein
MTAIRFYQCCQHCPDSCRHDDRHTIECHDEDANGKVCTEGSEQVEVVTP